MKGVKYILSFLFALLGLFNEIEAKIILVENDKTESFSEQDFKEELAEKEWLGLLYFQEKSINQNPTSLLQFSSGSLAQNFRVMNSMYIGH